MTNLVIGVDGGGTKTHVIVADAHGNERASADAAGSAVVPGRVDRAAEAISRAIETALAGENLDEMTVTVLVAGLAGAGRAEEQRAIQHALNGLGIADEIRVVADGTIALEDAFGDAPGILLAAGTGSVAFGRGPGGELGRCGGWGPVVGDEGSGTWLARRALAIVGAAADGREPPTALTGALLTAAQVNEPEELIAWAAVADNSVLAALAPVVFTMAQTDPRANALVDLAAEELVLHVRALARRLFGEERAAFSLALAGGLLQRGSLLRKKLEQRVKSATPGALVRAEPVVPARGAVRMAARMLSTRE